MRPGAERYRHTILGGHSTKTAENSACADSIASPNGASCDLERGSEHYDHAADDHRVVMPGALMHVDATSFAIALDIADGAHAMQSPPERLCLSIILAVQTART
jgi:hypothetical protein